MSDDKQSAELLEFTSTIVAAHVANNAMPASEPPRLIATAHETLDAPGTEKDAEKPKPAVAIKKSVTPDNIAFLKHGKKPKMLKRQIKNSHNLASIQWSTREF
jgi:predicted transcriptional regulator